MPYYPPASSGSGISDIVEDTTPQLGGNLDTNGFNIQVSGDNGVLALTSDTDGGSYNIAADTTGVLAIYGSAGETLNVSLLDGYLELGAQTASTVPYLDANKRLVSSDVTPTELDYLDGVTSAVQTQLDAKASSSDLTTHMSDTTTHGTSGNVVGTSDSQTLTNKTISGSANTLSNIASTSLVEGFFRGRYQSDTSNTAPTGLTVQFGWGWILGDGTGYIAETVTFPTAFSAAPWVLCNFAGAKASSNPASIDELTVNIPANTALVGYSTDITASGFNANLNRSDASTLSNTTRWGYTWIAIGPV